MFAWFRKLARADSHAGAVADATPDDEQAGAEVAGLDFYKAIEAHQRWKVRLSAYVRGEGSEKLDWQVVCRDDQCTLGRWLHSRSDVAAAQQGLFTRLLDEHAEFHRCAGDVVQMADQGQREAALKLVINGDYARASHRVVATLSQMFLALSEAEAPARTSRP